MSTLEQVLPQFRAGYRIRLDGGPWLDPNTHCPPWATYAMNLSGLLSYKWESDTGDCDYSASCLDYEENDDCNE